MRSLGMFLTLGILFAFGTPAQAATGQANPYATATSRTPVDPQVRANVSRAAFGAKCPTILIGRDRLPLAVCTRPLGLAPQAYLFDKTGRTILATRTLAKNTPGDPIPAYLDQRGWLVLVNGDRVMWRLNHSQLPNGNWNLGMPQSADLTRAVGATDRVVGLLPDRAGRVWFATAAGVVGTADTSYNVVRSMRLRSPERIQQDLSLSGSRMKVTSTHAIYGFAATTAGVPKVMSRTAR